MGSVGGCGLGEKMGLALNRRSGHRRHGMSLRVLQRHRRTGRNPLESFFGTGGEGRTRCSLSRSRPQRSLYILLQSVSFGCARTCSYAGPSIAISRRRLRPQASIGT